MQTFHIGINEKDIFFKLRYTSPRIAENMSNVKMIPLLIFLIINTNPFIEPEILQLH